MSSLSFLPLPAPLVEPGLSCPICFEPYVASTRSPVISPGCGHSICKPCAVQKNSHICAICRHRNYSYVLQRHPLGDSDSNTLDAWFHVRSTSWPTNFALLDLMARTQRVMTEFSESVDELETARDLAMNPIDHRVCSKCETLEKRERLLLCKTCADEWNKKWNGKEEEELAPFILCGFCCHVDHSGHALIRYQPWAIKHHLHSTVSKCVSTVLSTKFDPDVEKGNNLMEKWIQNMKQFRSRGVRGNTYRSGLALGNSLMEERDRVLQSSNNLLSAVRARNVVVTMSAARLSALHVEAEVERNRGSAGGKK